VALFMPILVSHGLGNLRRQTLLAWTIAAAVIVAGLAFYDVWRTWPGAAGLVPSPRTLAICAVFVFVAHALVACSDADRRIVARYPTLFDLAWKLGVQLAIVLCFLVSFWIMARLGIALFDMIGLKGFGRVILHPSVAIPLTTVAAAAALQATDTSDDLVRSVRSLALSLLSWLLPVITTIALVFLVSLVVTGLQPLWATRNAALLLIAAAAVMVIYINAAYQDGDPSRRLPHILHVAGTLAAGLLIFLVWIAAYAVWLRVTQYGWTEDRIICAAAVLVAGMFAIGYLIAAVLPGPWLKFIERWNVYGTFFFLIVLFVLCTPLGDPMRISVANQLWRLKTGAVTAKNFDYDYLAWRGGRFGRDALTALKTSHNPTIAAAALRTDNIRLVAPDVAKSVTAQTLAAAITMHPEGHSLPQSFLTQNWNKMEAWEKGNLPYCSTAPSGRCDAVEVDLDGDGMGELLIISTFQYKGAPQEWRADVFRMDRTWHAVAYITSRCSLAERDDLLAGKFKLIGPAYRSLEMGQEVIHVMPRMTWDNHCMPSIFSVD
ncbi:MAG: DUF4153 domain-containing protein, partial [Rhizomicrobium sp.]|nr:DUF4153 domain-containing protein [Rhizomicrobium sp.]